MKDLQFKDLNVLPEIKKALELIGYEEMTPIQVASLPAIIEGKDVIAQAPTGTGKTCCFAVGAINIVDPASEAVQVLVLCPTRELAMQVTKEIRKIGQLTEGIRALTIYGGQSIDVQIRGLKKKPQIIIGTPGRVMDHLRRKTLNLSQIRLLILDEADEMLNMGFKEDIDTILTDASGDRQTLLFSATLPEPIIAISKQYQKDAIKIKTTYKDEVSIPNIKQYYIEIKEENKEDALCRIIDTYNFKQALVFGRTKKKVDELSLSLSTRGYQVEALHGDLSQAARDQVMEKFRKGISRILIATDVAARGLDIEGIDVIINYDLPEDQEYYVHRIGRTARAGRQGSAYTFVTKREVSKIKQYEKALKVKIEKTLPPTYELAEIKKITHHLEMIRESIYQNDLTKYIGYIEAFIAEDGFELTPVQYAAALLKEAIQNDTENKDQGKDLSENFSVKEKRSTPTDFVRYFINLGRKDKMTKKALVDFVSSKLNVDSKKIQGVEVLSTFSFIELPRELKEVALKVLNSVNYQGLKIALEESYPIDADTAALTDKKERKGQRSDSRKKSDSKKGKDYSRKEKSDFKGKKRENTDRKRSSSSKSNKTSNGKKLRSR